MKRFLYFIQQSILIGRKPGIRVVFHTTFCLIPFAAGPAASQPPLHLLNPAAVPFLSVISAPHLLFSNLQSALDYLFLIVRPTSRSSRNFRVKHPVLKSPVCSGLFVLERPSHIVHPAVSGHTVQPHASGNIQRQIQRHFLTLNPDLAISVRHPSSVSPI